MFHGCKLESARFKNDQRLEGGSYRFGKAGEFGQRVTLMVTDELAPQISLSCGWRAVASHPSSMYGIYANGNRIACGGHERLVSMHSSPSSRSTRRLDRTTRPLMPTRCAATSSLPDSLKGVLLGEVMKYAEAPNGQILQEGISRSPRVLGFKVDAVWLWPRTSP